MQQGHDQPGATGADRVAEGASAAIDVQFCVRDAQLAHRCHRNCRKGFVDLEQVNRVDAPAGFFQQFTDCADRCGGEPLRLLRMGGVRHDPRQRLQSTRLGLVEPTTLLQPSPFDWNTQALCYLPPSLPEPMSRDYNGALIDALRPVLVASAGRAFVLFASHRALRGAAEALRGGPWPLFVQGEAPRHVLLQRFRESGNGVLLGAASFREGVDVAGEALSVVVIDKLPFAAPDDPVFEARLDAVRRAGGNPFRDEQLPQAVIALKQGAGRLIRSERDRGVLVLCDPRLLGKSYGRVFLDSLPPLPRTRRIDDVEAFFAAESPCMTGAASQ